MSDKYMSYNRKEFESGLLKIAKNLNLQVGDYTEKQGKQNIEERVYEMTTPNPVIRILIYSSIDPRTNISREVGGDAIRINFYCKFNGKTYYKKFKTHQRIKTMFDNIEKSIQEINKEKMKKELSNWIYKVSQN